MPNQVLAPLDALRRRPALRLRQAGVAVAALLLLLVGAGLAGCSSDGSAATAAEAPTAAEVDVEVPASAVLIDVRTPEEYAEGHLDGAVNLDVSSGQLEAELAGLDPDGTYFVYCRSGNRSAAAVATMEDAGFSAVTDLGGLEAAARRTGIEIVD